MPKMIPGHQRQSANRPARIAAPISLLLLAFALCAAAQTSNLKRDQEAVFFPALGHLVDGGRSWELEIHGCVYEPDQRRVALALLREALDLKHVKMNPAESALFAERARLFMVDHKRGKRIVVRVGNQQFVLGKSRPDGQFSGIVRVPAAEMEKNGGPPFGILAILPPDDHRTFAGELNLFGDTGLTVISDIDDTIKITQVRDRNAALRNTFLEPFRLVPGMAEVYRGWAEKSGAQFCYVSASPWQLFLPLSEFVRSNGFPGGVFYLKNFRWKDESFFKLFEGPEKYKPAVIEPLLRRFPDRRFVLVGDSGEKDPEIYGALARQYPEQVAHIFIRNVTDESPGSRRYQQAFRDLPPGLWKVFREPAEISHL